MRPRRIHIAALAFTALLLAALAAWAGPFTSIVVFGDSLSDSGNISTLTAGAVPRSPPYYQGRYSNGPTYVDLLAERYGLSLTPALQGGTNYAFGGATTGPAAANFPGSFESPPSLLTQLGAYLGSRGAAGADRTGLYVVYGGSNDLFQAAQSANPSATVSSGVGNIVSIVRALVSAGATTILVPNLPNLGLTPAARASGSAVVQLLSALSQSFNAALASALQSLRASFGSSVNLVGLDVYDTFQALVAAGNTTFSNVTDPCLQEDLVQVIVNATVCATPDEYLFWDMRHPTAAGHRLLAEAAAAALEPYVQTATRESDAQVAVAEPGTLASFGAGLLGIGGLVLWRRRAGGGRPAAMAALLRTGLAPGWQGGDFPPS